MRFMLALFLRHYYELTKERAGYKEEVTNECKNYLEILKKKEIKQGGQNYTKRILKNVGCDDVEWSHVTRDRIQCRAFVGKVTSLRMM
jgi:hypothetical protein